MKLEKEDIESIAKGRVSRATNKTSNTWMFGWLAVTLIGLYVFNNVARVAGIGLIVIATAPYFWYLNGITKKRKVLTSQLLKEWEKERGVSK